MDFSHTHHFRLSPNLLPFPVNTGSTTGYPRPSIKVRGCKEVGAGGGEIWLRRKGGRGKREKRKGNRVGSSLFRHRTPESDVQSRGKGLKTGDNVGAFLWVVFVRDSHSFPRTSEVYPFSFSDHGKFGALVWGETAVGPGELVVGRSPVRGHNGSLGRPSQSRRRQSLHGSGKDFP